MVIDDDLETSGRKTDELSGDVLITGNDVLIMIGNFFYLSIMSMIVGVAIGLLCSRILRDVDMNYDSIKEAMFILLFGYLGYLIAEELDLSGIISMFCSGLVLAHYAYWNINTKARVGVDIAANSIAQIA